MTDHLALELKLDRDRRGRHVRGLRSRLRRDRPVGDAVAPGAFRKSLAAHKRIRPDAV